MAKKITGYIKLQVPAGDAKPSPPIGPASSARSSLSSSVAGLVVDAKAVSPVPVAVGFGVSKPAHVRAIARAGADGVVVASALVDALGEDGRNVTALGALVEKLRDATRA